MFERLRVLAHERKEFTEKEKSLIDTIVRSIASSHGKNTVINWDKQWALADLEARSKLGMNRPERKEEA